MKRRWLLLLFSGWLQVAVAQESEAAFDARVQSLASQLRCLVCQNESIADSQAPLAADLREQIRRQLREGRSDDEIRRYMTDRYGDFVLYEPPLSGRTWLLWFGPALMLLVGGVVLMRVLSARRRLPDEAFEPAGAEQEQDY
jgi:cytochrome c-type biogenesis protein CcmH